MSDLAFGPASTARLAKAACLAALGVFFLSLGIQKIWSPDIWWQLRTGQLIAESGSVPRIESLSHTAAGRTWIELRWIYCLVSYGLWRLGGAVLLGLAQVAVLGLTFGLLAWGARRAFHSPAGIAVVALAMSASFSRFAYRPELATYLFAAVYLVILDTAGPWRFRRALWLLPVLQVLWTNTHTLFVFGPIIVWLFALESVFAAKRGAGDMGRAESSLPAAFVLAATITLACFVNPYGWRGATFPLLLWTEIGRESILGQVIDELRSPLSAPVGAWSWDLYAALALIIVTAATFVRCRRVSLARLALFAATIGLFAMALRNVGLLGIVALWCCLRNIEDTRARSREGPAPPASVGARGGSARPQAALVCGMLLASWYVTTDRFSVRMGAPCRTGLGVVAQTVPIDAADFLRAARPRGPIFNSLADGAFFAWALPEYPVFIDGRLEVYGDRFVGQYALAEPAQFSGLLDRWSINTAVLQTPRFLPHAAALRATPDWALVYVDARNMVFVRDVPDHAELLARHRVDFAQVAAAIGETDQPPSGWRRWIGSVEIPWRAIGVADTMLALGATVPAEATLRAAAARFPSDMDLGLRRAALLELRGRGEEARALLSGLDTDDARLQWHDRFLVKLLASEGRTAEVRGIAERMIRRDPVDAEANSVLAPIRLAAGDLHAAAEAYRLALRSFPDRWDLWAGLAVSAEASDEAAALDAYQRAAKLRPTDPSLLNQIGVFHASRGRPAEARRMFEAALSIDPGYLAARANLARLPGG